MIVKGNHEFKVTPEKLWNYLMDPEVLAKITPGVSKLERTGEDSYNTVSDIKMGPVKGVFKGKLNVSDKSPPNSFVINMEQLSKIGNAHGQIKMQIAETANGNAELFFDGDTKLSGMIARTGQRVLSGVANAITKEVFAGLEKHIEEDASNNSTEATQAPPIVSEPIVEEKVVKRDNTQISNNSLAGKMLEDISIPDKIETVATAPTTSNSEGGLFAAIGNFFKSIFKSK